MGIASLGIGAGLYPASVPPEVLVLAFAPAMVAIGVLAVRSTFAGASPATKEDEPTDVHHG